MRTTVGCVRVLGAAWLLVAGAAAPAFAVPKPKININDITVAEGDFGSVSAVFTVTLTFSTTNTVTVQFATANGTATAPADYVATQGILSFPPGSTSQTITVPVNGDVLDEPNETFFVNLTKPKFATIQDRQGQATIIDDDVTPSLAINDATVVEGNAGSVNAIFTVSLSSPSGLTVSVNFATQDGTAAAGADYVAQTGTLTFPPGTTLRQITVAVFGDLLAEANETFFVNLSVPVNATIADGQGLGTINDDDAVPAVSINDVTLIEGNSGTTNASFLVTLSAPSGQTVSVAYATADGTATAGSDYVAAAGTLTFPPGTTVLPVVVAVNGDTLPEANETFFVNLSAPVNATIADGQGLGTIADDDSGPVLFINDVSVTEGNAGTVNANFTVSLSTASGQTVTVDYATADGTATAPADYLPGSGTVTFPPGTTTRTVSVAVNGDLLDEPDETFLVNLSNPTNAAIADGQGMGTILDDDPLPSLAVNDVTVTEGDTGSVPAVFTVTLSAPSGQTVSVNVATADGTAAGGSDYLAAAGTLTFPPGTTSQTFTVSVLGDTLDEANETYFVNLTNSAHAAVADGQGLGTILDNDPAPTLSIDDVALAEGDAGSFNADFTVTLSTASGQTVTVSYATANGTANAGSDYVATSGTLTFPPGTTTRTVSVPVNGDTTVEPNETFFVNLSGPVNATIADGQGLGTILNDDGTTISIDDVAVTEGNAGTVNAVFTLDLSDPSATNVTVDYATADGTATAGPDYVAASGTVLFPPGTLTQTVTVVVNGDVLDEQDETFFVNLSNATGGTIFDNQGLGTILDDDPTASLSIDDVTVVEGNSGVVNAVFTVTLSAPSGQTVGVDFATQDGTATAGSDYVAQAGSLTFPPGTTTRQITVAVLGDTLPEPDETFFVNLSNPTNAAIADGQGLGTIVNDDAPAALAINDVTVVEGNSGTTNATFLVSLSTPSGQTVSVSYATADGTATAGSDYIATAGTLTFPPGTTLLPLTVLVIGDTLPEANETFFVNLSAPVNATIADGQGLGTIADDDGGVVLFIDDVSVTEGNAGTVNASFTVSLSAPSGQTVTVDYATADGTAIAPADYLPGSGTVTFPPGTTTRTVTVAVNGDLLDEPDETFLLNLSNPTNAIIADGQGVGTILDDDPQPSLSIDDVTVTEGDTTSVTATFTVTLSAPSGQTVTVNFATADGTASAGSDYLAAAGTLTFPPGTTTSTVDVTVLGDTIDEADETYFVNLTNASGATVADGQGLGTILDNDPAPTLSIDDVTVTEGNAGTSNADFTVSLLGASQQTVTVSYATADGTATAGSDYGATSGTLTFPPGTAARTVSVPIIGDIVIEPNETFFVNLTAPVNAIIADGQGLGTILNDDGVTISIDDVTVTEGDGGAVGAVFTVTLSAAAAGAVTVDYATADGTAMAGSDYVPASGTLLFPPGTTVQTVTVAVNGDDIAEPFETFFVNLSNAAGATIFDGQGLGTILDDDASAELSHGFDEMYNLAAQPGPVAVTDLFRIAQQPRSSYEIVVDSTSGDIGDPGAPVSLERVTGDGAAVLQAAKAVGVGFDRSLRWQNTTSVGILDELVRVKSAGCTTDCGPDDVYRIRAYETTCSIPRFNNAGSQVTVLILQNPTDYAIAGNSWFWSPAGALLASQPFSLAAKAILVLNSAAVPGLAGQGGTVSVSHDGRYGDLAGKTVALEPTTGFSFDSPMVARVTARRAVGP